MPQPDKRQRPTKRESKHWLEHGIFWLLFGTLIATGFAAHYTRQQFVIAHDTERRQLRAYVLIRGGGVKLTDDQTGAQAFIQVQNYGQTPGYDFETWTGIALGQAGDSPYAGSGAPRQKSIIGPSADFNVPSDVLRLSPDQLSAVRARHAAIFVWGYIRYKDAFERCWEFVFKDRVAGPTDGLRDRDTQQIAGNGWGLAPDPRHGYSETQKQCTGLSGPP